MRPLAPRLLEHLTDVTVAGRTPGTAPTWDGARYIHTAAGDFAIVMHGTDALHPRPSDVSAVYWIGSVPPHQSVAKPADFWFNTYGMEF